MKDIPKPNRAFHPELEIVAQNGETDGQNDDFHYIPTHFLTILHTLFINLIDFLYIL